MPLIKNPHSGSISRRPGVAAFQEAAISGPGGGFQFGFLWLLVNRWPWEGTAQQVKASVGHMEFVLIGGLTFYFSMLVAIFFGCVMVMIMKGPEYRADGIDLSDADKPDR